MKKIIRSFGLAFCLLWVGVLSASALNASPQRDESAADGTWQWSAPRQRTFWEHLADDATVFCLGVGIPILGYIGYCAISQRQLKRCMQLLNSFPGRVGVCDASERVFFFQTDDPEHVGIQVRKLRDIPSIDYQQISAAFAEVFASGKPQALEYKYGSSLRAMTITPLAESIFRRRCIAWFSYDNTGLQRERRRTEEYATQLRQTLQSIGDGVLVTDAAGRITMLNPIAEHLMGHTEQEAEGRPHEELFRIVSYLDDTPVPSPLRKALDSGEVMQLANHTDLIARNGSRRHIADSAAPIRNAEGELIGGILVFRDVTDEYDKRDRLHNALLLQEYCSELASVAAFKLDRKTNVMTGSRLLPAYWPQRPDGTAAAPDEWVHPDDIAEFNQALAMTLGGTAKHMAVEYRAGSEKEWRHFRLKASLDHSEPQKIQLIGVIQDITEITASLRQLKDTLNLWNLVLDSIPVMIFAKKAGDDFRYVVGNKHFAEFVGRSASGIVGYTDYDIFKERELAEWFRNKDLEIMAKGVPEEFFESPLDGNDNIRHLRTTKIPFVGASGEAMLLGVTVDITELDARIQSERLTGDSLSQVLLENDFQSNIRQIFETLAAQFRCDRVSLALFDEEQKHFRFHFSHAPNCRPRTQLSPDQITRYCLFQQDALRNELTVVHDSVAEGHEDYAAISDIRAFIGAPIYIEGKLWGEVLVGFNDRVHHFSLAEEAMMRAIAKIIALAQLRERQMLAVRRADLLNQLILNNIQIPIWLFDRHGKLMRANTAAETLAGLASEDLAMASSRQSLLGETPPDDEQPLALALASGRSVRRERRYQEKDYIIHAEPVFDDGQELCYVVKSAVDVTELNAFVANEKMMNFCLETFFRNGDIEEVLSEVLKAFSIRMEASHAYLLRFDREKQSASLFSAYSLQSGDCQLQKEVDYPISPAEMEIESLQQGRYLFIPDVQMPEFRARRTAWGIQNSKTRSVFSVGIHCAGELWGVFCFACEDVRTDLNESNRNLLQAIQYVIGLMLDRKTAQERLLSALHAARAADKAKSYFIATVSHEIRTPLNAVIGFSELLRDSEVDRQTQQDYLDGIASSGNALLQLINDVLDLSKLEAGQMKINLQRTDFAELCGDVVNVFRYGAERKGLELGLTLAPASMPRLWIDKLRIRQILFNLLGNAVKFTVQGSIQVEVEFTPVEPESGTLVFRVRDSGCGIAEQDLKTLFDPFVQADGIRGTHAANNGTGLGLAITRRLLERMAGEISVTSDPGRGSCFCVRLNQVTFDTQSEMAVPPTAETLRNVCRQCSVLIADDVPMNLKVLHSMLRNIGCDVEMAGSGMEVLKLLETRSFDLLLTDLWMPGMNGAELAATIRSRFGKKLRIIAVTADMENQANFDMSHFDDVLSKPTTMLKLRQLIENTVSATT